MSLSRFANMELKIQNFSQFSKNAKDTFRLEDNQRGIIVAGVIGNKVMDVFFGRIVGDREEDHAHIIDQFEQKLIDKHFGHHFVEIDQVNS